MTEPKLTRAQVMDLARLVDQAEAGRRVGVSRARVGRLVKEGKLTAIKIEGRKYVQVLERVERNKRLPVRRRRPLEISATVNRSQGRRPLRRARSRGDLARCR